MVGFRKVRRFLAGIGLLIGSMVVACAADDKTAGRIESFEFHSKVLNNTWKIRVLLPPGYSERGKVRYPVFYINDGYEVFRYWDLPSVVTPLIQARTIMPLIVVGIDHAGEKERPDEDLTERANEYLPYPSLTEF